jgi:hypothetical protein
MTTTVVDGIAHFGKLMDVWPVHYMHKYTPVTVAEFDDIMQTIDYVMSNWNDCSEVLCRFGSVAYIRGRNENATVLMSNDFLQHIKYQAPSL